MRASYEINQGRSADGTNYHHHHPHYASRTSSSGAGDNIYRAGGGAVGSGYADPFPIKEAAAEQEFNGGNVLTELAPKARNGLSEPSAPLAGAQSAVIASAPLHQQHRQEIEQKTPALFGYKDDQPPLKRKLSSKIYAPNHRDDENQRTRSQLDPYAINEQHLHPHQQLHQHQLYANSTYANSQHQPYLEHKVGDGNGTDYCWRDESLAEENQQVRLDQSSAAFNSSASLEGQQLSYRVAGEQLQARAEVRSDFKQQQAAYPQPLWPDELIAETGNSHGRFASSGGYQSDDELKLSSAEKQQQQPTSGQQTVVDNNASNEYNQLRILEMRKEKSRDAARSRRSKENHEFYELAKLLPLPAAITSQLDFLDKASIIRLTISFLKLRQFSVNGHPPWAPDFTTLGSVNPYSSQSLSNYAEHCSGNSQDDSQSRPTSVGLAAIKPNSNVTIASVSSTTNHGYSSGVYGEQAPKSHDVSGVHHLDLSSSIPPSSIAFPVIDPYQQPSNSHQDRSLLMNEKNLSKSTSSLFDVHQGTHILQSLDGFAFAIGRDGRFLYISETVSMYLGLSQVEMTGSSVFDYAHQQDHEELAKQLGIPYTTNESSHDVTNSCESPQPASVHSQYSVASNETFIDDHVNPNSRRKRIKTQPSSASRGAYGRGGKRQGTSKHAIKIEASTSGTSLNKSPSPDEGPYQRGSIKDGNVRNETQGTEEDPLVRQFCIRMKSTLTKRGCQHFKSSGYRVVHVVAHLRSYQSNDHGHLMDPLDDVSALSSSSSKQSGRRRSLKSVNKDASSKESVKGLIDTAVNDKKPATKSKIIGMVAVAIALPPPSINELRLESGTFVLRLSLDLRVTHIEPKITELLHYPLELIAGTSLYSLIHPADVHQVQKCHKDLLKKGQMMSGYYRMLSRSGGYIWVQTCATLICNNTFNGQVPVLPNSPMPNSSSVNMTHSDHHQHNHLNNKLSGYMAPPNIAGSDVAPFNASNNHSKIASPALSSHISSNYDNQDQDQCVIFVNYMITNIVDSNEILDICQSSIPLCSFSGNTNNNNAIFNSPSSSCSSPCLGTMKANTSCGSYASPGTPNSNANLLSPRARIHPMESKSREARVANGRQRTGCGKMKSAFPGGVNGDENGHRQGGNNFSGTNEEVNLTNNANYHPEPVASATTTSGSGAAYGFYQGSRSATSALDKAHATETSWLAHHQPASLLSDASVAFGSTGNPALNHYSSMDRSIYKAAFGLDVAGANYGHQHQATVYPARTTSYPTNASVTNTWDTATAAAVAAVSNLTHHHHHNAANAYAQLESNHHQAAAHTFSHPASNHHTSASTYYNYYGYYGNEFI